MSDAVGDDIQLEPNVTICRDNNLVRDLVQLGFASGYLTESMSLVSNENIAASATSDQGERGLVGQVSVPRIVEVRGNVGRKKVAEGGSRDALKSTTETKSIHTEALAVSI